MKMRKLLLAHPDLQLRNLLEKSVLIPAGYEVTWITDRSSILEYLSDNQPDLVIIGENLKDGSSLELADQLTIEHPDTPILLIINRISPAFIQAAIRSGISDCLILPIHPQDVHAALVRAQNRQKAFDDWSHSIAQQYNQSLHFPEASLGTLQPEEHTASIIHEINPELSKIVSSAVALSRAENGYILLLDQNKGEFYMGAAHNFPVEFTSTFRLPIRNSLAGKVLRSGEPVVLFEQTARKIRTSYLVHALIYVPIKVDESIIGVLGVDRQSPGQPFTEQDVILVESLASIAAITIQNTRQKLQSEIKCSKLETILSQVETGLVVIGKDGRIILVNPVARKLLGVEDHHIEGRPAKDVFRHPDVADIFENHESTARRTEINLEDGRVYNAQITPLPEVGLAIVMQEITHLKELDRIKTDFVNTVSHDLRSPLTAILGYAELIDRAGPTTEQQKEFIHRIQSGVQNITAMINDLLDLGRIEAGFDARMEIVHLPEIIQYALEGLRKRYTEKNQTIELNAPNHPPDILGNPSRLRQMIENLITNAIKFTPVEGKVMITVRAEADQIILQVTDNGPGIPAKDQPHIFEKFYRGSNIPTGVPGTGLGLAIVKSIVENHHGRVWLNSKLGQGSTFTVVLPIAQ